MLDIFFFKFEFLWLFWICYILILHLINKFGKFKLNFEDFIIVCIFFIFLLAQCAWEDLEGEHTVYLFNDFFIYNNFIRILKLTISAFIFIYLIMLLNFSDIIKLPDVEYLILILVCIFSLLMIIISNHLFIIFLFLEVVNICLYCLIGLNKDSNMGIECAYKYFIQSSFATIIGFFAISLIYLSTGTLFLNELMSFNNYINMNYITIFSVFVLITSVFFKLGIFPLHSWIADVYQGSFLITALFIATIPKLAYVYLFLKIYIVFSNILMNYCFFFSIISIIYGSIITLYQINFKRLLAYGSMVHIGFIIYSLSLFTLMSITASLFYLLTYILLMLFVFSFMFFLFEKNEKGLFYIDDVSRFNNILNKNYLLSAYFIFILLSIAGLPFFIGFISKWYIFLSLLSNNQLIELFVLLGASIISAAYYIRLIRFIYFVENKNNKVKIYTNIKYKKIFYNIIILLFIINILVIFFHNWIYLYLFKCVLSLFI